MFLRALFSAIRRLTAAINRSAALFESANDQLDQQLEENGESQPQDKRLTNGRLAKLPR